jgi:aerobic carbon-monoxide dehydrogenase medium subunit
MGLASPARLVDIGGLPVRTVERAGGKIALDALTRHRTLELDPAVARSLPLAAEAARHIGNVRVRNRGTLGGSLAHADPAAELGAVALAHGGEICAIGPDGERRIPIDDFFVGYYTTALGEAEILTAVELDEAPPGTGHGFSEVANRADDFATAAAAALVTVADGSDVCTRARLALAGTDARPIRVTSVEAICVGKRRDDGVMSQLAHHLRELVQPEDDAFTSADHRRKTAAACAVRAVTSAWDRASNGGAG